MSPERSSHSPESTAQRFDFLTTRGELAQLIREKDWSKTPLGAVEHWPQPLKTALAICLDSKFATYLWWGPDLIQLYNDAAIAHLGVKHPAALGMPVRESRRDVWPQIEKLVGRVLQGEAVFAEDFEVRPERDDTPNPAWFTFSYTPLRDQHGKVAGILITSVETTDKVRSEIALRASEQRFRAIVESATEYAIITFDSAGRITSWNPGAERVLGYSEDEAIGQHGEIFFTPEDRERGLPAIEMTHAHEYGRSSDERWHMRKNGALFWGSGVMLPIEDHPRDRYLKIFRDNTEARRRHERDQLLAGELNHRVKNTLAIVQSIVMQTLRRSDCSDAVRSALESRLVALARAHDALTSGNWSGGDLRGTAEDTLRLVLQESFNTRAHLHGPDIHLNANALLGLSLALHELATNGVKYGALSNDSGKVEIGWEISDGAEPQFRLRWIERGGPSVEQPATPGFGSRMIEEGLAHEFDGRVELKFAREGLECTIRAPLHEITGERR